MQILPFFPKRNLIEILQYPDKRLRIVCKTVTQFNNEAEQISKDLIHVVKKLDSPFIPWLGMAANQLGYDKRIIVLKGSFHNYTIMINPEIIEKKWLYPTVSSCFSFKGLYLVKKYFWLRIRYQDSHGKSHEETIKGGHASVLQQELDHINGILICDF